MMTVARSLLMLFAPVVARRPGLDASLPSLALARDLDWNGVPTALAEEASATVQLAPPILERPVVEHTSDNKNVVRSRGREEVKSTSLLETDSAASTNINAAADSITDIDSSASTDINTSADSMTALGASASTDVADTESSASTKVDLLADSMTESRRGEVVERELFSAFIEADQDKSQTLSFDEATRALSDGKGLEGEDRQRLQWLFHASDSNKDGHIGMDEIDGFIDGVYNEFEDEVHRDLADDLRSIPVHGKQVHYDQHIAVLHAKAEQLTKQISALQMQSDEEEAEYDDDEDD